MSLFQNIASKLIVELGRKEIEAYIWHAATTGSVYIRFQDARMCSIRIGDHEGRSKLKYKYNLRSDMSMGRAKWIKDNGVWRYYLNLSQWKDIIPVLEARKEQVKDWPKKYEYHVPHFKK